jgi:hypothetical protein
MSRPSAGPARGPSGLGSSSRQSANPGNATGQPPRRSAGPLPGTLDSLHLNTLIIRDGSRSIISRLIQLQALLERRPPYASINLYNNLHFFPFQLIYVLLRLLEYHLL